MTDQELKDRRAKEEKEIKDLLPKLMKAYHAQGAVLFLLQDVKEQHHLIGRQRSATGMTCIVLDDPELMSTLPNVFEDLARDLRAHMKDDGIREPDVTRYTPIFD